MNTEDVFSIVWISIAGTIAALSAANARRKKQAAARQHTPAQQVRKEARPVDRATAFTGAGNAAPQRNSFEPATATDPTAHEVSKSATPERQPEADSVTADNFDLRQAVVYAEILRPKFEE